MFLLGIMCELLWSDPSPTLGRSPSKRGVGVAFGSDVTKNFLKQNNLGNSSLKCEIYVFILICVIVCLYMYACVYMHEISSSSNCWWCLSCHCSMSIFIYIWALVPMISSSGNLYILSGYSSC